MANEHIFKSNVIVTGSIETSTGFVGDGSGLTGVTSVTVWDGKLNGDSAITGSLTVSSSTATVDFVKTAGVTGSFTGSFKGNGSHLTNLNISNATATGVNLTGNFIGNGSALTGLEPFPYYGDAKITGSLIVSSSLVDFTDTTAISGSTFSGSFVGDGTGLSGLTASPAGSDHEVQFNDNGTTGASSNFRFNTSTLYVSESIQISKSGSGALELFQSYDDINISTLQARGAGGSNMGTFLFQGRTPYGTTSDYMTLSGAVLDVTGALIKGGKISVGGYPVTTPTTAQGNLYVKRNTSSGGTNGDTVATFINSDSGAYGGGGFIDIIGNSNDYASGGIRVKNGTSTDGEIYYAAGSRQIILHTNKRGISLNSSGLLYKNNNVTQFVINHSGDVGIGTTTPNYKLEVNGTLGVNRTDGIIFAGSLGSGMGNKITADTSNNFVFSTSLPSAPYTVSERMRITNAGNVGIGTNSPQAKLDVSSTTDGVLLPRLTQTQILSISSPATGLTLYNTTDNVLVYYNGTQWRALSSTAMIVPV